ncbi:MAG: hypothetical protein ACRDAM_20405 [Casimicrobium sp.]
MAGMMMALAGARGPNVTPASAAFSSSILALLKTPTPPGGEIQLTNNVIVTGGVGPFTFNTVWFSGGASISIAAPTSASPTFISNSNFDASRTGVARCTVTDQGNGNLQTTCDCQVSMAWE